MHSIKQHSNCRHPQQVGRDYMAHQMASQLDPPTEVHKHSEQTASWTRPSSTLLFRLNRLRTGHGRFGHMMQKVGLREDAACTCGEAKQTAEHVINFCPDTKCYGDFLALDKAATDWLHKLNIDI